MCILCFHYFKSGSPSTLAVTGKFRGVCSSREMLILCNFANFVSDAPSFLTKCLIDVRCYLLAQGVLRIPGYLIGPGAQGCPWDPSHPFGLQGTYISYDVNVPLKRPEVEVGVDKTAEGLAHQVTPADHLGLLAQENQRDPVLQDSQVIQGCLYLLLVLGGLFHGDHGRPYHLADHGYL